MEPYQNIPNIDISRGDISEIDEKIRFRARNKLERQIIIVMLNTKYGITGHKSEMNYNIPEVKTCLSADFQE